MKGLKLVLITILMVLAWTVSFGQNEQDINNPEKIDIYKFDPTVGMPKDGIQLNVKAYELYQKGDYEMAARYYLAYVKTNPEVAIAWYNLSCCYGLLGNAEYAAKYLKIAYKKGFTDVGHVEKDPDYDKIRSEKDFTTVVDSLRAWNEKKAFYLGTMEYFPSEHLMPYWIHMPKNYDKDKPATLLIGLHGFGDKAYNFTYIWRHIEDSNVIFVVPEAPYPFTEGDQAAFSWAPFTAMESKTSEIAYGMVNEYILDLVEHMENQYKIDQTWLMGFSQGAYFGYMLALKNPDEFDGLLACGGGLITEVFKDKEYKKAKNMKVIISHGSQDRVVDFSEGQKAYDTLKAKGLDVKLLTFEGGHSISPDAMKEFLKYVR